MNRAKIYGFRVLAHLVTACILSSCSSRVADNAGCGEIKLDGSSTVFPLSQAAAEDYHRHYPLSRILIGISGTSSGFTKFSQGLTDINNASRVMLQTENAACRHNGISYVAIPLCYDEIMVLVSKSNTWVDSLSMAELHLIWAPASQGKILYWNQVRSSWPHKLIHLYSPGPASGTYEYFTEAVNGKARLCREDVNPSFDPERLVKNLSSDELGLSYFGYIYYRRNINLLRQVPLRQFIAHQPRVGGKLANRNPLSRILYLYINKKAMQKQEFRRFILFYLASLPQLIAETGYVPLNKSIDSVRLHGHLPLPAEGCSAGQLEAYLSSYQLKTLR